MKYLIAILSIVLIASCSFGPIHITHKKGELPKVKIDTPSDKCKVRVKNQKEAKMKCKWKF